MNLPDKDRCQIINSSGAAWAVSLEFEYYLTMLPCNQDRDFWEL